MLFYESIGGLPDLVESLGWKRDGILIFIIYSVYFDNGLPY
ncbi:DUF6366 family protein [Gracilibacillus orientalis]|nr:DUF6366 family protein [Gracilibacillus orientalis]